LLCRADRILSAAPGRFYEKRPGGLTAAMIDELSLKWRARSVFLTLGPHSATGNSLTITPLQRTTLEQLCDQLAAHPWPNAELDELVDPKLGIITGFQELLNELEGHCHINRSDSELGRLGAEVRPPRSRFAKPRTMWSEALCA
jgi:hypothetical protein